MKTTIEDHQLLRSFTKEIFTSEVDLLDVGFLLDLHPSVVKQKLWDYPRSIEMASYMVVSEWWDSLDASREEKYGVLCDAVHSIGKKCTAQRLKKLVLENGLSPQPQAISYMSHEPGCFQHKAVNSSAFGESNTLTHKSGPHLAICTNLSAIVHEGIGTSSNIDDTSEGFGGLRSDSGDLSHSSSRMVPPAYAISRADGKTGRGKNVSEEKAVSANDTDVFETVGDADVSGEERGDLGVVVSRSNRSGEIDNGNSEGKGMAVSFCGAEYSNDQLAHSQTHYAQVNSFNEENIVVEDKKERKRDNNTFDLETVHKREIKLKSVGQLSCLEPNDIDKHPDVSPDSGLFEPFGESVCDLGPDEVNYLLPEIRIADEVSSQLLNTTRKEHANQNLSSPAVNGQTGVVNGQTGVVNGQTGVVNGQTGVVNGQTGVVNGQTGVVNGQTGVVNGQTGVVNGQTGVVNGQAGVRDDQILEQNTDVHRNKLGLFQRMLGFFWRKRTRKVKETRVEFDSDDQPVWETVNIPDSYCLLEKYPSDDAEAW